jgi:hypothetical protein
MSSSTGDNCYKQSGEKVFPAEFRTEYLERYFYTILFCELKYKALEKT